MKFKCAVLVSIFLFSQGIDANYLLEVKAVSYSNPTHKASSGRCCDRFRFNNCTHRFCHYCDCDNRFFFCLRSGPRTSQNRNTGNCPLGSYSVAGLKSDSFTFDTTSLADRVPNPLLFLGSVWPGGFQLYISVVDEDVDIDDHVDDIFVDITLSPSTSFTPVQTFTGIYNNSMVELSFRVTCLVADTGTCEVDNPLTCEDGWTDPANGCRTPICARDCHAEGGHCNVPGECLCNAGWRGDNCDQCIPPSTCIGGYCNRPGQCLCSESSASEGQTNCDSDADTPPCLKLSPCRNGATCINDDMGGYSCSCQPGYMGTNCQTEVNECDPNPCKHGGSCMDLLNRHKCLCAPGYKGINCEAEIDECLPHPCINQGTCVDQVDGYSCICAPEFTGFDCEIDMDRCRSNPCLNGGNCHDGYDSFTCSCPSGYFGHDCSVKTVACLSSPCQNGVCFDVAEDSFICDCDPGYTGISCEVKIPASNDTAREMNNTDAAADTSITVSAALASLLVLALLIIALLVICVCVKRRKPRAVSNHTICNNTTQLNLDNPAYNGKVPPKPSPDDEPLDNPRKLSVSPIENPVYMEEAPVTENIQVSNPMYKITNSEASADDEESGSWISSEEEEEEEEEEGSSWEAGDLGAPPHYSTLQ